MATIDFQDWELLHSSSDSDSGEPLNRIDSAGLIHVNYFSSDMRNRFEEDIDDDKSAADIAYHRQSDLGSENDPTPRLSNESVDLSFDSSCDDRKFVEMEEIKEIIFSQDDKKEARVEGIGKMLEAEAEDLGILYLDSNEAEIISPEHGVVAGEVDSHIEPEAAREESYEMERIGSGGEVIEDRRSKENSELKKRSVVWWKMPVEFLKYCVFRMSPLCAISIAAAAMMGFAILGRRWYRMKKKTKGLEIKVTVDDEKISQVMSRAARLNEAFLIVKRVPVVRPSLPSVGSTNSWPGLQ